MTATDLSPPRRAVSPYARRLARERGIALARVSGSGPAGRIVAADLEGYVPAGKESPSPASGGGSLPAAFASTIDLTSVRSLLAGVAGADAFTLEDVALRAAGCALDDVPAASALLGSAVALETGGHAQMVFSDIRRSSLGPLRQRRLEAMAAGVDQGAQPATLSLRVIAAADIRPVSMPLLADRAMRLVLVAGEDRAECIIVSDPARVGEDAATELLSRFRGYLQVPILLLA